MANNTLVQTYEKVFLFIFVIYCIWNHFFTHERWVPILDSFNLAIHEAGHPFFAMIHRDLMIYGGTIFQLITPLLFIFYFKKHQNSIAFSFSLIWFAENLFNIARYVEDARMTALPLAGSREAIHDWNYILTTWDLLDYDTMFGNILMSTGGVIIILTCFWIIKK